MTTRYITLSAGISKVMTMSVSTMQIFIEINFEGDKIAFKTESYTRDHFIFNQLNSPKASLINFI